MRREERVTVQGPRKGATTRRNVTQGGGGHSGEPRAHDAVSFCAQESFDRPVVFCGGVREGAFGRGYAAGPPLPAPSPAPAHLRPHLCVRCLGPMRLCTRLPRARAPVARAHLPRAPARSRVIWRSQILLSRTWDAACSYGVPGATGAGINERRIMRGPFPTTSSSPAGHRGPVWARAHLLLSHVRRPGRCVARAQSPVEGEGVLLRAQCGLGSLGGPALPPGAPPPPRVHLFPPKRRWTDLDFAGASVVRGAGDWGRG